MPWNGNLACVRVVPGEDVGFTSGAAGRYSSLSALFRSGSGLEVCLGV